MRIHNIVLFFFGLISLYILTIIGSSCAQVMYPTGGKRDSLPPVLVTSNPLQRTTNFKGNRITLTFDEYIVIDQLRENLLVSPTPKNDPYVDFKLKTVSIKVRDTLEPNTTYTINFGKAIKDNNEGNILKNFSYVFSTGPVIDSLTFGGKVLVAETGKADSTIQVFLYQNLADTAVQTQKPKYIARLDSSGNFSFKNLPVGVFNVYALKDGDGGKTYNSKIELFAFADSVVNINQNTGSINLYAFAEEKEKPKNSKASGPTEKKLKYSTKTGTERQDILSDLLIEFNKPLKNFDPQKILLTDTLYNTFKDALVNIDTTRKVISVKNKWIPDASYKVLISNDVGSDSTGLALAKSDTIRFKTKSENEYGSIKINFTNFDKSKNNVLQFVKNNEVFKAYPLQSASWKELLFEPGDYEIRILFDDNHNGYWDPGNYTKKLQPEKVYSIPQKLTLRANWENERDIEIRYL